MEVDINGDGTIDFEVHLEQTGQFSLFVLQEFLGMMKQKANEADQESDLREAFKIFDREQEKSLLINYNLEMFFSSARTDLQI